MAKSKRKGTRKVTKVHKKVVTKATKSRAAEVK
jgi:hypothetical protein